MWLDRVRRASERLGLGCKDLVFTALLPFFFSLQVNKVGHLLKLADEYLARAVLDL